MIKQSAYVISGKRVYMIYHRAVKNVRDTLTKLQQLLYRRNSKSTSVQCPSKTSQLPIKLYSSLGVLSYHSYSSIVSCNYHARICVLTISPLYHCTGVKILFPVKYLPLIQDPSPSILWSWTTNNKKIQTKLTLVAEPWKIFVRPILQNKSQSIRTVSRPNYWGFVMMQFKSPRHVVMKLSNSETCL